jgi:hypothetical protein
MMANSFKTLDGREYHIRITMGVVRRTEKILGERLTVIFVKPELREKYLHNDLMFMDVLCAILSRQIEKAGITREDFEEELPPDTFRIAYDLVLEGLAYFFEEPLRGLILKNLKKARELTDELKDQLSAAADEESQKLDKMTLESLVNSLTPTSSPSSSPVNAA